MTMKQMKFVIVSICVIIVVIILTTTYLSTQQTGTVKITTNSRAVVTLNRIGYEEKIAGTGNQLLRLKAGDYQITATDGKKVTTRTCTIAAQQNINVNVETQELKAASIIASYTAQNIYADSNVIRFFNTPFSRLFSITADQNTAQSYMEHVYPITEAFWHDASHIFVKNEYGVWSYANEQNSQFLPVAHLNYVTDSFSFNRNGMSSFIDESHKVYLLKSPAATPVQLGSFQLSNAQTAINVNGDVLVYGRNNNNQQSVIFHASGEQQKLPSFIKNPSFATWSADNSKIAFALNTGIIIYDVMNKTVTNATFQKPSHPESLTWISATELAFSQATAIWKTNGITTTKLADVGGTLPNAAFAQRGNELVYGSVPKSDGTGGYIYKLTL